MHFLCIHFEYFARASDTHTRLVCVSRRIRRIVCLWRRTGRRGGAGNGGGATLPHFSARAKRISRNAFFTLRARVFRHSRCGVVVVAIKKSIDARAPSNLRANTHTHNNNEPRGVVCVCVSVCDARSGGGEVERERERANELERAAAAAAILRAAVGADFHSNDRRRRRRRTNNGTHTYKPNNG